MLHSNVSVGRAASITSGGIFQHSLQWDPSNRSFSLVTRVFFFPNIDGQTNKLMMNMQFLERSQTHHSRILWMADTWNPVSNISRYLQQNLPSSGVPPGKSNLLVWSTRLTEYKGCVPREYKHHTLKMVHFFSLSSSTRGWRATSFLKPLMWLFLCWDSTPCFTANRMISKTNIETTPPPF